MEVPCESGAKSLMANSVMEAQDCPSLGAIRVRYSIPLLPGVNTPQLRSLVGLDRVVLTEDQAMTILRSAVAAHLGVSDGRARDLLRRAGVLYPIQPNRRRGPAPVVHRRAWSW